jgi:CheY-like chemotaxis protein
MERAIVVARGMAHLLANDIVPAAGVLEILRARGDQPPPVADLIARAVIGLADAREHLLQLQSALRSASVNAPPAAPTRPQQRPEQVAANGPESGTAVVIADDDAHVRALICATLTSDRYAVHVAADGDEAWELIRQHRPGVAVLDVRMPGRSGLDLLRAVRLDPGLHTTRVILLTGEGPDALARPVAAEFQADLLLTKPFSPGRLLSAVEQALGID